MIPKSNLEELNKAIEDFGVLYSALRNFLLELKALDDGRIKTLFEKYEVEVK